MGLAWWQGVLVPLLIAAGSALGYWLRRTEQARRDNRQERADERADERAMLTTAIAHLKGQAEAATNELAQITPQLATVRREYAAAVEREIELLDKIRSLAAQAAAEREKHADELAQTRRELVVLSRRVRQLRSVLVEHGIAVPPEPHVDELPDEGAL
jgi:chromosome segregation ATPase